MTRPQDDVEMSRMLIFADCLGLIGKSKRGASDSTEDFIVTAWIAAEEMLSAAIALSACAIEVCPEAARRTSLLLLVPTEYRENVSDIIDGGAASSAKTRGGGES
jgi:hypothetical protein